MNDLQPLELINPVRIEPRFPWHTRPWEIFTKQLSNKNVPHGILLSGAAGLGKYQFAQQVAQLLLCQQRKANEACGACSACHLFASKSHPDFYLVQPEADSQVVKIDAIRTLCEQLSQTALLGGYKVAVITPVEAMNNAASNALLKTLEEPPSNTILLLITSHPEQLLATIRSRCQTLSFALPDSVTAAHWLTQLKVDNAAAYLALSEGAPLTALEWANDATRQQQYDSFMQGLQKFMQEGDILAVVQQWLNLKEAPLLTWLQQFYMDVIRRKFVAATDYFTHRQYGALIEFASTQLSTDNAYTALILIQETAKLFRKQPNLNLQLQLEALLIRLAGAHGK